jgi:hypothetical protein
VKNFSSRDQPWWTGSQYHKILSPVALSPSFETAGQAGGRAAGGNDAFSFSNRHGTSLPLLRLQLLFYLTTENLSNLPVPTPPVPAIPIIVQNNRTTTLRGVWDNGELLGKTQSHELRIIPKPNPPRSAARRGAARMLWPSLWQESFRDNPQGGLLLGYPQFTTFSFLAYLRAGRRTYRDHADLEARAMRIED